MDENIFEKFNKDPESVTEEDIQALVRDSMGGGDPDKKTDDPPPEVSVTLEDGSVIKAGSHEELSKLLAARLAGGHREEPKPVEEKPPQPGQRPEWDYEEYQKKFLADPRAGTDYMETTRYGVPVSQAVIPLVQYVAKMAQKLQAVETQQFLASNPDFQKAPENEAAIKQVIAERGWDTSAQSLGDAYAIAKASGRIKAEKVGEPKEPEKKPFVPPRTGGSSSDSGELTNEQLLEAAHNMPLDKLQELVTKGRLAGLNKN